MQTKYLDAITAQIDLLKFYDSDRGIKAIQEHWPSKNEVDRAAFAYAVVSLKAGQPVYVDGEIVDMLKDAVGTFPREATITREDIPFQSGFVFLGGQSWDVDEFSVAGYKTSVDAFSWMSQKDTDGIVMFFWGRNNSVDMGKFAGGRQIVSIDGWNFDRPWDDPPDNIHFGVQAYRALNNFPFTSDSAKDDQDIELRIYLRGAQMRQIAWSILHFMQQKIAVHTTGGFPRQMRRNGDLNRFLAPPDNVQIVQLRAQEPVPGQVREGHGHGPLTVRFVRRGHWRNQFYPSINSHKPIWIDATIVGPEGAPVKNPQKLYVVNR